MIELSERKPGEPFPWEGLKVGDIVTCTSYSGIHRIEALHRAKRLSPQTLVEFKTWNPEKNQFSRFTKNSSLGNFALANDDITKFITSTLQE